jgi:hypothetical protein
VLFETAYLAADRTGDPEALVVAVLDSAGLRLDQHRTSEASSS